MFQRILMPLDGSARAEQALPVAARLAQASGGTVLLLRVISPTTGLGSYPLADPQVTQMLIDTELQEASNYLESMTRVGHLSDVHTETEVIVGQPAATILSQVETAHSDLIVMCSHGRTGFKRWALGSVAEKVADHAPVPVLLLREGGSRLAGLSPEAVGPLHALIPLDGSVLAKAAIAPAAQLIAAVSAPGPGALHLTRVVVLPHGKQLNHSEREAILHRAKQYLRATGEHIRQGLVASPVADLKLSITWSVSIDEDIAAGIVRVAQDGEDAAGAGVFGRCDLIAMATHGYGGLQRWAMGSVTERVLHASRLPILMVRPAQMGDKDQQSQDQAALAEFS